jgi:hypothetical protein
MSWGIKVIIGFSVFVIMVLIMVGRSMSEDVNLVTDNYYEKELKYQDQIDKVNRTKELKDNLKITSGTNAFLFKFPSEFLPNEITGNIHLYRPSSHLQDVTLPIKSDTEGKQIIDNSKLERGLWKIKVDWAVNDTTYFNQKSIILE